MAVQSAATGVEVPAEPTTPPTAAETPTAANTADFDRALDRASMPTDGMLLAQATPAAAQPTARVRAAVERVTNQSSTVSGAYQAANDIRSTLNGLSQGERDQFVKGLIDNNNRGNYVGLAMGTAHQLGDNNLISRSMNTLWNARQIDHADVVRLVDPTRTHAAGFADAATGLSQIINNTGNRGLINDAFRTVWADVQNPRRIEASSNPDASRNDAYTMAVDFANGALHAGDDHAAKTLLDKAWQDSGFRDKLVDELIRGHAGVNHAVEMINTINPWAAPGLADKAENLFEAMVLKSDQFRDDRRALHGLGEYFNDNAYRLLEEAAQPRAGDDTSAAAIRNERDDTVLISSFVENIMLNPNYDGQTQSLNAMLNVVDRLHTTIGDPSKPDEARFLAADMLGTWVGSFEKGTLDYIEHQGSNNAAGLLKKVGDWAIEFTKAKNLPYVGPFIRDLKDSTVDAIRNRLNQNPEQYVNQVVGDLSHLLSPVTLPDSTGGRVDVRLATQLDVTYNDGYRQGRTPNFDPRN